MDTAIRSLTFFQHKPAATWGDDEREHVRFLTNDLAQGLRMYTYFTNDVNTTEGRHLGWPDGLSAQAYFHKLRNKWVSQQNDTADGEGETEE